MKKLTAIAAALLVGAASYAGAATVLSTQTQKQSYAIGYDIGHSFKLQGMDLNETVLAEGLSTGLSGAKPEMSTSEMTNTLKALQQNMMKKVMAKRDAKASKNLLLSDAYLTKVASMPGVKKLENGLYYKVLTAGTGSKPTAHDQVKVNYRGMLMNGKVFADTFKKNQPATFTVDSLIPGWSKALQVMPVGSIWMIYIAPHLAYGKNGNIGIGPNEALTFKVQLLSAMSGSHKK